MFEVIDDAVSTVSVENHPGMTEVIQIKYDQDSHLRKSRIKI